MDGPEAQVVEMVDELTVGDIPRPEEPLEGLARAMEQVVFSPPATLNTPPLSPKLSSESSDSDV